MKYILSFFLILFSMYSYAVDHLGKDVKTIHSPDHRACTFFMLEGVSLADPVAPSNGWFAVPIAHSGHDVIVSILLAAYTTGKKINVRTSGASACSTAGVSSVHFAY